MAFFGAKAKSKVDEDPLLRLPVPVDGDRESAISFLRGLIAQVRPPIDKPEEAEPRLRQVVSRIESDPFLADSLRRALRICLRDADLLPLLTESGLTLSRSLGRELSNRVKHKLLPVLRDERDFLVVIDTVFHDPDDFRWVERMPLALWGDFFSLIPYDLHGAGRWVGSQLQRALDILSVHVAHLGCEPEVSDSLPDQRPLAFNPFMRQQESIRALHRLAEDDRGQDRRDRAVRAKSSIGECHAAIHAIRSNMHERGASLAQTFILYQMEMHLGRMSLILDIIDGDGRIDMPRLADYFVRVVRNQNRKYSLREFLSQTTGYLAYQIAEQKGRRGHAYITHSRGDYREMLFSAMKGGLIVCFIALAKNMVSLVRMAPFWQGLAFSLNYSAGFILIDRTGATLATKQPAYTANAVAGSIETNRGGTGGMQGLVETVARVSRSQIASFFGNLVVVFPGTYLLAWGLDTLFGFRIVEGEDAMRLIMSQHPTRSLSLLYACNTGVFLFLSGIINGYVQNKMRYGRIAERIRRHPGLSVTISPPRLERIAAFWDRNAGAIAGSVALGFFLGMAWLVGRFFGIPFDIRHITISAGNASIGLYGIDHADLPVRELMTVFFGVLTIGFLNFLVSFSLAFYVAMRSRGLRLRHWKDFNATLYRHLLRRPRDFIFPPRRSLTGNAGGKV
jgi:site-specific recombinase